MPDDSGLTVKTIFEEGFLGDAILFLKTLAQQQVGDGRGLTSQLIPVTHHHLAPLLTEQRQRSVDIEILYMIVQVDHLR